MFQIHLALPGALEILRSTAEFMQALAQLAAELRKPAGSKENQGCCQNKQQLGIAHGIQNQKKHCVTLSTALMRLGRKQIVARSATVGTERRVEVAPSLEFKL